MCMRECGNHLSCGLLPVIFADFKTTNISVRTLLSAANNAAESQGNTSFFYFATGQQFIQKKQKKKERNSPLKDNVFKTKGPHVPWLVTKTHKDVLFNISQFNTQTDILQKQQTRFYGFGRDMQ